MKYLLDTNICIALIRQKPVKVIESLVACAPGDVGVSTITIAELTYGAQKSSQTTQNIESLEQFLLPIEVMDFNQPAALVYGGLRAMLEKKGTPIGSLDMLIAAHALSLDVILVTHNTREFERVPKLILEDWLA